MQFRFQSILPLVRACCLLLFLWGSGWQPTLAGTEQKEPEARQAVAAESHHPVPYLCRTELLHQEALAPAAPECAPADASGPALLPWLAAGSMLYCLAASQAPVRLLLPRPVVGQQARRLLIALAPNAP